MTLDSSPTAAMPVPSETAAVSSGSIVADSVPNTMNSTTPAAMKPIGRAVEALDGSPFSAMSPLAWNCTSPREAPVTRALNRFASELPISDEVSLKVTSANAIRPEGAIWPAAPGAYGEPIRVTCGSRAIRASIASVLTRTLALMTDPCATAITTCSVSPWRFGWIRCNSALASKLSVWGSVRSFEYSLPTPMASAVEPTVTTSQMATTIRRCPKHQRARALIDMCVG